MGKQCLAQVHLWPPGTLHQIAPDVALQDAEDGGSLDGGAAEVEYYSVSEMAIEMIYLRNLLSSMGLQQEDYMEVFEDNTACIKWSNHVLGGRDRAKHIDIRKHFAHEAVQNGHMRLYQIPTEFQLADIFTKGPFERCLYNLLCEDPPRRADYRLED